MTLELIQLGVSRDHPLAMKSTVPVGTGNRLHALVRSRGAEVGYASNPEFREGSGISDFMKPVRVVVGTFDLAAGDRLKKLDRPLAPIHEWPELVGPDWAAQTKTMRQPVVVDGRNVLDGEAMGKAGCVFAAIGRGEG